MVRYAQDKGVSRAARKFNKGRSYIYFWLERYEGTLESLVSRSRRPHGHPNQQNQEEIKLVANMRKRNPKLGLMEFWFKLRERGYQRHYVSLFRLMMRMGWFVRAEHQKQQYIPKPYEQMSHPGERVQIDVKWVPLECNVGDTRQRFYQFTAIDEYSRLRYLGAFDEATTHTAMLFVRDTVAWFARRGIKIECVQTDNGHEFTKRLLRTRDEENLTSFELLLQALGIRHKYIKPYTPRHNGKVERSHREDQKRLYDSAKFHSFEDFANQLKRHNQRSNNIPMRPLGFTSPRQFLLNTVQYV
ncbi:MAG: Integrase core domain [Chloroflexi bacterium]|nr:MAG: Integrase core domain [Chloroflexota bacterium]